MRRSAPALLVDRHVPVKHLEHENAEGGPVVWPCAVRLFLKLGPGSRTIHWRPRAIGALRIGDLILKPTVPFAPGASTEHQARLRVVVPRIQVSVLSFVLHGELIISRPDQVLDPVSHIFIFLLLPEIGAENPDAGEAVFPRRLAIAI